MAKAKNDMNIKRKIDRDRFIKATLDNNLCAKKAMEQLNPDLEPKALSVKLSRWLNNPDIITTLAHEVQRLKLTPEQYKGIIQGKLLSVILDDREKTSDQIQACMAQAKVSGILSEATQTNIAIMTSEQMQGFVTKYRSKEPDSQHIVDDLQYAQDIDE